MKKKLKIIKKYLTSSEIEPHLILSLVTNVPIECLLWPDKVVPFDESEFDATRPLLKIVKWVNLCIPKKKWNSSYFCSNTSSSIEFFCASLYEPILSRRFVLSVISLLLLCCPFILCEYVAPLFKFKFNGRKNVLLLAISFR